MSAVPTTPVTEADLHAYADDQLPPARRAEVETYLADHPAEAARVEAWKRDSAALRELLAPVMQAPIPPALAVTPRRRSGPWRKVALAASLAFLGVAIGWIARGALDPQYPSAAVGGSDAHISGFAQRAAVAHVVYSPDVRRPVEVSAAQEEQLVAWVSKRLGASVKPPQLGALGYELIGGRVLPGEQGPVAQFMYHDAQGRRLTLYITSEAADSGASAFRFARQGAVNLFYWVDGRFGYAISAGIDRRELEHVATEVYRQLAQS